MDTQSFEQKIKMMDELIEDKLNTKDKKVISDGVIHPSSYLIAKFKILWLLKESYDNENDGEGGWSLAGLLGSDDVYERFLKKTRSKKTWYPIIYTSYGILNNFMPYGDMDFIDKEQSMVAVLKSIAYININKLAGESTSNHSELKNNFLANKEILKMQIDLLNPDIIIGGNTLKFYNELLALSNLSKGISKNNTRFYYNENKLLIDAYHPSRIGIQRYQYVNEDYIDDIIFICKSFINKELSTVS